MSVLLKDILQHRSNNKNKKNTKLRKKNPSLVVLVALGRCSLSSWVPKRHYQTFVIIMSWIPASVLHLCGTGSRAVLTVAVAVVGRWRRNAHNDMASCFHNDAEAPPVTTSINTMPPLSLSSSLLHAGGVCPFLAPHADYSCSWNRKEKKCWGMLSEVKNIIVSIKSVY